MRAPSSLAQPRDTLSLSTAGLSEDNCTSVKMTVHHASHGEENNMGKGIISEYKKCLEGMEKGRMLLGRNSGLFNAQTRGKVII